MEDPKFQDLLTTIREFQARIFFLPKKCAYPLIDEFLEENPILLTIHDKNWYYKNLLSDNDTQN